MRKQLNCNITPELYTKLSNKSKESGVPLAVIIRRLVKKYLAGEVKI